MKKLQTKKQTAIILVIVTVFTGLIFLNSVSGIADPSAIYCNNLGYEQFIKDSPKGEYGVCRLPDNTEVEGWKFFKGEVGNEYNYCSQKGHEIKMASGSECGFTKKCVICVLKDGTEMRVDKLMEKEAKEPVETTITPNVIEKDKSRSPYLNIIFVILAVIIIGLGVMVLKKRKKNILK